jgi:archaemetzincin
VSSHAYGVGYHRPNLQERTGATQQANEKALLAQKGISCAASFPGPLVLPGDDLALDPGYPPQSVQEWLRDENRNEVASSKNVIYVAAPPFVQANVDFVSTWTHPLQPAENVACLEVPSILDYLRAFFYSFPIKLLTSPTLSFTDWSTKRGKSKTTSPSPRFIGLDTSTECIRIRTRSSADGIFTRQLNVDDLLDAAISILPDDAFALLLLMQHDLYENADDVFTCGRAYGGSRVTAISMARYHPYLGTPTEC